VLGRLPELKNQAQKLLDEELNPDQRLRVETLAKVINESDLILAKMSLGEKLNDTDLEIVKRIRFLFGDD